MMMATRNDIKDRLIHNQSPYPTKDKVLSYTIPVDHSESLLFCGTSSQQDNASLNFITSDRDSLASFLDEGLGTSLDGVDEIASPIFPTLGRNDSGVFSSDEGTATVQGSSGHLSSHNGNLVATPISSCSSIPISISISSATSSDVAVSTTAGCNNIISVADVVSWKGSGGTGNILLSPATATISVVTDATTGIPSFICTPAAGPTPSNSNNDAVVKPEAAPVTKVVNSLISSSATSGGGSKSHSQPRNKSMPLGRQGPQKCTICDKVFSNASALTKHKLTHSDERRHACATCGKAFKRQDHLNGHMLTHRNKKPFECKSKGCGKSYCDARSLRRHVENRHGHEVLESMNLTSHHNKHKNSNHNNSQNNHQIINAQSPQPELAPGNLQSQQPPSVTFTLAKIDVNEPPQRKGCKTTPKVLDSMPVLQPEHPQLQLQIDSSCEKVISSAPLPPLLQKSGESCSPSQPLLIPGIPSATTVPIVLKRENVSVFDFDETIEDAPPIIPQVPSTPDKLVSSFPNSTIKVGNIIDSSKLGALPDIRLIQEWTKRLGDSKVALFLASSSAASSLAQLAGPMASIQLDGQPSTVAMSATSHAFIPTSENGLFSVTPISIVPTSSGEFTFKPAHLSVPTSESPKPLYIVPSEPLLSSIPTTISVSAPLPLPTPSLPPICSIPPPPPIPTVSSVPKPSQPPPSKTKEPKTKDKVKPAIGATLANRIKSKLKAGSLKKLGKSGPVSTKEGIASKNPREIPKLSPPIMTTTVVTPTKAQSSEDMVKAVVTLPIPQIPLGLPPSGGSGPPWCEGSNDCLFNGMEEDRLSEGADGEDKPVECSICCRRFKNTPALNGHMRLHGGYFKKETEGSKKKDQVSKEPAHSTPLQTASVSVRALIEEKIKERRNNLLKLAAAAAAEKAANEGGAQPSNESTSQPQPAPHPKHGKGEKHSKSKHGAGGDRKTSTSPTTMIAQQPELTLETVKLKVEPGSEKDTTCCDQDTNTVCINGGGSSNTITANSSTEVIDASFQDLNVLIGESGIGDGLNNNGDFLPSLLKDGSQQLQQQQNVTTGFPMDKFTLLDCGINPDDLCQAFHLIYVENNGSDLPLAMDQDTLGKVSKMFQDPLPELSTMSGGGVNDGQLIKGIVEPVICPSQDDPCNLPWEWRNSTSSDNTDNSLSTVQDCVSSLLCSSSSEITEESSKDPIAGGGYCYTPILSPNSTFCLTPGPDSPFEATSHSLSFICPSPSIGTGSSFNEPGSNLANPPSVEPLFTSADQSPAASSINLSVNLSQSLGSLQVDTALPKYNGQLHQHQMETSLFVTGFDAVPQSRPAAVPNALQILPQHLPQIPLPVQSTGSNAMDCLPVINNFPLLTQPVTSSQNGVVTNDYPKLETNLGPTLISTSAKDIVLHCPVSNGGLQSFVPFEVFTPVPLPKKIWEKWACGKMDRCRKINVGPEYQAEIPVLRANKGKIKAYKSVDEKLWDPSILNRCSSEEVDKYLEFACCSAVPGGGENKEYALHLLTFSRGNIREALLRLMEKLPSLPPKLRSYSYVENQRWTSEEIMAFQISLVQAGKDFTRISKGVGTKSQMECVSFYYFWKKVCPGEYQMMRQIWRDRLDHQQQSQTLTLSNNTNNNHNNSMNFFLTAQELRSFCK